MMQRARVAWAAAFRAPFVAHRMSPAPLAVMVALLVLSHTSLWAASCSDPGILPRASVVGAVPDAPSAPALAAATARYEPILRAVSVRGRTVQLKYCTACLIFRPPRASHCRECDSCIGAVGRGRARSGGRHHGCSPSRRRRAAGRRRAARCRPLRPPCVCAPADLDTARRRPHSSPSDQRATWFPPPPAPRGGSDPSPQTARGCQTASADATTATTCPSS